MSARKPVGRALVDALQSYSDPGRRDLGLDVGQELRELDPRRGVIERTERDADQVRVVEQPGRAVREHDLRRLLAQASRERGEALGGVARERAGVAARVAQSEELVERRLRAGIAAQARRERHQPRLAATAGRPRDRVEHAVDDQRAHAAGEQVGVGDAEVGTVRVAGIGEPLVADRGAQHVEVARHVGGRHVVDDAVRRGGRRRAADSGRPRSRCRSSSRVSGNANGVKYGSHSSALSKQRSGVLRMMPRGSKPTRSKRARTSSVYSCGPAPTRKSTPEPPGPPGLRNSEPMRRAGIGGGQPRESDRDRRRARGRS